MRQETLQTMFSDWSDEELRNEAIRDQNAAAIVASKAELFRENYQLTGVDYDRRLTIMFQRNAAGFAYLARIKLLELVRRQDDV